MTRRCGLRSRALVGRRFAIGLLLSVAAFGGSASPAARDALTIWHVQSVAETDQPHAADGSAGAPFRSLADAESAAGPGDEIRVLAPRPGARALDGGIVLKPGQRLRGVDDAGPRPTITNTDATRHGGDAVTLADDSLVTGLVIAAAAGHAIVGRNVQGATITHNQIQGANLADLTSVGTGATAGMGVAEFPKAAVAFLHDASTAQESAPRANTVTENSIGGLQRDGGDLVRLGGAGIALLARSHGRASLVVSANRISDLGAGFPRSGVLVDTQDRAEATVEIDDTSVANAHASSDGILIVAQHESAVSASIRRYRFVGGTPGQGMGNNGLEVVTYHGANRLQTDLTAIERHAARSRVLMEDSDIEGAAGFGIAIWNIFGKPSPETVLDLGGGELGGRGRNRIHGNGIELPASMDIYVINHDLNIANNWWGVDGSSGPKVIQAGGNWRLGDAYVFACPGKPDQLQKLVEGSGTGLWSMFCQVYRDDVCTKDARVDRCCDPTASADRCLVTPAASAVVSSPALVNDPRP